MANERDANRDLAEQRLNMGQDPGGAYPDLRDRYRRNQQELTRSSHQSYSSHDSSNYSSRSESKPRTSQTNAASTRTSSPSSGPSLQEISTLAGFIGGVFLGIKIFGSNISEHWIGILLIALGCAGLARVTYKLIIGVAIVVVAVMVFFDTDKQSKTNRPANVSSQSNGQPAADTSGRELRITNKCHKQASLALRYRKPNDEWETNGWWILDANTDTITSGVLSNNSIFYIYATADDRIQWNGQEDNPDDRTLAFRGKSYRFQKIQAIKGSDGKWTFSLAKCSK